MYQIKSYNWFLGPMSALKGNVIQILLKSYLIWHLKFVLRSKGTHEG